jgi:hypothetical protein
MLGERVAMIEVEVWSSRVGVYLDFREGVLSQAEYVRVRKSSGRLLKISVVTY